jgi:hypothetical protein
MRHERHSEAQADINLFNLCLSAPGHHSAKSVDRLPLSPLWRKPHNCCSLVSTSTHGPSMRHTRRLDTSERKEQ